MKKPRIDSYPVTDSRTFAKLDGTIDWCKYAMKLDEYIQYMENLTTMKSLNERKIEKQKEIIKSYAKLTTIKDDLTVIQTALHSYVDSDEYSPAYRKLEAKEAAIYFQTEHIRKHISKLNKELAALDKEDELCDHPLHNRMKGNQCGNCGRFLIDKEVEQPTVGETLLKTIEEARKQGFTLEFKGMWWIEKAMEEYAKIYAQSQKPSRERIMEMLNEYDIIHPYQYEQVADELKT
jgi:hypothetical protein